MISHTLHDWCDRTQLTIKHLHGTPQRYVVWTCPICQDQPCGVRVRGSELRALAHARISVEGHFRSRHKSFLRSA